MRWWKNLPITKKLYCVVGIMAAVEFFTLSVTFGEALRWKDHTLIFSLLILVITLGGTGLLVTFCIGRGLSNNLQRLRNFAHGIGTGNYDQIMPVHSKDEIGQLGMALAKMSHSLKEKTAETAQAEEASKIKSLFLANMSHEIRTPLSVILGFSELMRDPDATQAERDHYAGIVKRTGDNLTTIINDILDISKVEADRLEIEKTSFSLSQLLRDMELYIKIRFDEQSVDFKMTPKGEVPDYIISDPTRLRQVLLNIVGNAMKFTKKGQVELIYYVEDQFLTFTIRDTGIGISQEQQKRLFKSFSQGDSSIRRRYGGTGLGLILSRKLARLLGGDVSLVQTSPHGSTFKVVIAFEESRPAVSVVPLRLVRDRESLPLSGKRVLVVEDIAENQLLLRLYLNKSGAFADFASNGVEGIKKTEESKFDLVLMDMQMPVMDGYTATNELRQRGFEAPIIALTGHAMKEDREKCLKAGCNAYLTKPIDRSTLINMVILFTRESPLSTSVI